MTRQRPTFKQARKLILDYLRNQGWTVKPDLKVPHATSPDKTMRLWFKPQAVYLETRGPPWSLGAARSLHVDLRDVEDPSKLVAYAKAW